MQFINHRPNLRQLHGIIHVFRLNISLVHLEVQKSLYLFFPVFNWFGYGLHVSQMGYHPVRNRNEIQLHGINGLHFHPSHFPTTTFIFLNVQIGFRHPSFERKSIAILYRLIFSFHVSHHLIMGRVSRSFRGTHQGKNPLVG